MATINASVSISSDILNYPVRINKTMTMKKIQSCHGLEETTGMRSKKFTATTDAVIIEADELTSSSAKAHKVYIRNTSSNKANFFFVSYNSGTADATTTEPIGKLYGGDWMLFPYDGGTNITVASNTADTQVLEYMVFADGIVAAAG
tara:strand:+ start:128 stop:568 length:441 start_codon:yes stop_codon:yes gene_type:complete